MAGIDDDVRDVTERVRAYGEAWRATAISTELADRPRAERAIRSLYRAAGDPTPKVVWVASPTAGLVAAGLRRGDPRMDPRPGDDRRHRARLEPAVERPRRTARPRPSVGPPSREAPRAPSRAGDSRRRPREPPGIRWRTPSASSGSKGPRPILPAVRQVAADARVAPTSIDTAKPDAEVLQRLGTNLLGESWTTLTRMIGDDLAVEMLASATREAAHELVDGPFESRAAEQAMQPGQFDVRTPVLAAAREVFGERLWRYRTGRRVHEVGIDARLELARSAGPWWALDGLAIVCERPLVAHTDDRGRLHAEHGPALAWSDGLEVWAWHGVAVDREHRRGARIDHGQGDRRRAEHRAPPGARRALRRGAVGPRGRRQARRRGRDRPAVASGRCRRRGRTTRP